MTPRYGWDEVKGFAEAMARILAAEHPDRYLAEMSKSRRKGKIFVDYLRNGRGATAIAPYSSRARASAGVATPLAWDELPSLTAADLYTLGNIENRMAQLGADPWAEMGKIKQMLPKTKASTLRAAASRKRVPA